MLAFPVTAGLGSFVVLALGFSNLFGLAGMLVTDGLGLNPDSAGEPVLIYLTVFLIWLSVLSVVSVCNAGLIYCVNQALDDERPSLLGGFGAAVRALPTLLIYAVVLAAVGTLLKAIERRTGLRLAASLVGFSVSLLTFLVVPVAVLDRESTPISSFRTSATLFSQTWGETTAIRLGTMLTAMLPVTGLLVIFYTFLFADALVFGTGVSTILLDSGPFLFGVAGAVGLSLLAGSTVTAVAKAGLYRYSINHEPGVFDATTAETALQVNQGRSNN
jgi:hypothetical protein